MVIIPKKMHYKVFPSASHYGSFSVFPRQGVDMEIITAPCVDRPTVEVSEHQSVLDLGELELALVGGGTGDICLG